MKKVLLVLLTACLLAGCSLQTFERVEDPNDVQAMATPGKILLELPGSAAVPAMEGTYGSLYFCGDYEISVETLLSGNLDSTLKTLTGFGKEDISLLETQRKGISCYEGVWSAAGENGDCIGRIMVLDDGSFHYCVTVMTPAENAAMCISEWNELFSSVTLSED